MDPRHVSIAGYVAAGLAGVWGLYSLMKRRPSAPGAPAPEGPAPTNDGWGGSEAVAEKGKRVAATLGIPVTSQKRNLEDTVRVGSHTGSDHYTGNLTAYAVDFGASGPRGDDLAAALATAYGVPKEKLGTFQGHPFTSGGQTFRVQLLWRVDGHFDHVHLGIRRV